MLSSRFGNIIHDIPGKSWYDHLNISDSRKLEKILHSYSVLQFLDNPPPSTASTEGCCIVMLQMGDVIILQIPE